MEAVDATSALWQPAAMPEWNGIDTSGFRKAGFPDSIVYLSIF
jgi:hypothetical protein